MREVNKISEKSSYGSPFGVFNRLVKVLATKTYSHLALFSYLAKT